MVKAVDRLDLHPSHLAVLQHIDGDRRAGSALGPDLSIEICQVLWRLAVDADDDIAAFEPCFLRRAARSHSAHEQTPAQLVGVDPEPRPPGPGNAAVGDEVPQHRQQAIDGYEHIARGLVAPPAASPTMSGPTPTNLPSRLISAAPLQAGCGGAVNR